jgi:hypothetical protein
LGENGSRDTLCHDTIEFLQVFYPDLVAGRIVQTEHDLYRFGPCRDVAKALCCMAAGPLGRIRSVGRLHRLGLVATVEIALFIEKGRLHLQHFIGCRQARVAKCYRLLCQQVCFDGIYSGFDGRRQIHNIRCSVIYPVGMDTGWHKERNPDFLNPEDVGKFLLHLITQDARFVVNEAVVTPINEGGP